MRTLDSVDAELSAPGSPFERVQAEVNGAPVSVFKHRHRDLRSVLQASAQFGDAELFVFEDGPTLSFREHIRVVASVASALRDLHDIQPGDRVALLGENSAEWIVAAWATLAIGGIVVGMNGWWKADEIRYGLELSEPKLLIADRKRLSRNHRDHADDEQTQPDDHEHPVVGVDKPAGLPQRRE